MAQASPPDRTERVLVLAPTGRDAALAVEVLAGGGFQAVEVPDARALTAALDRGAALAVVAEEALGPAELAALAAAVRRQPAWSDLPFVVFSAEGPDGGSRDRLAALGNVTLVERPVRLATLLSVVNAGLRSRRRQYDLRDLLVDLHEGVRQRDHFLAMLGHELRNPLNALLTAAEIIDVAERGEAGATDRGLAARQAAVIRRQGRVLTRLVDDLLEVARVTSGKVALHPEPLDARDVVRRVVDASEARAREAGLHLRYTEAGETARVLADPTRLEQIVGNLLSNALKYTPAGGQVEVSLRGDAEEVELAVRDTGLGIEPDVLPHVFELFHQGDRTLDRAQGGLGIGLTLVRTLVELHGGSVGAESAGQGQGSSFRVRLPRAAPAEVPPLPPPGRADARPRGARRVVVVEDHEDSRETLVFLLERLGHQVQAAADGPRGVQAIVSGRPEVAVVDVGLPGLDGYGVAAQVRQALGREVFLVALTGYGQREDRERALSAGFDAHLTKPVDIARLEALLTGTAKA